MYYLRVYATPFQSMKTANFQWQKQVTMRSTKKGQDRQKSFFLKDGFSVNQRLANKANMT